MLAFSVRSRRTISVALLAAALAAAIGAEACTVYDVQAPTRATTAGVAGAGGSTSSTVGGSGSGGSGSTGNGGAGNTGGDGTGGAWSNPDGSTGDAPSSDAVTSDVISTVDVGNDDTTGTAADGGAADVELADALVEGGDPDVTTPPSDVTTDADATTDANGPDTAETGALDVDSGSTGVQILPRHGTPIAKPDAGAPFDSRCASDEVVTGFIARAGVQTDAIGSTCSKLIGGVLSAPHNLPLNGNLTGGSPVTITCPANYVAVGIVGRYGHSTMWSEDITTGIGIVCKDLGSTATQIVTITPTGLDSGYMSFREDCTGGRYLTDISGQPDSNSLAYTVGQVGGECSVR
jgi:hypothetical protein